MMHKILINIQTFLIFYATFIHANFYTQYVIGSVSSDLTDEDIDNLMKEFEADSYPGATIPLSQIAGMMNSPDPGKAVATNSISAAG